MHIRAAAGQEHAVDRVEKGADIGHVGQGGYDQRQRPGHLGEGAQIAADGVLGHAELTRQRAGHHGTAGRDSAGDGLAPSKRKSLQIVHNHS